MYPKPPDMREKETQELTDGEMFYVIRNGIRFTGMPGWGQGPEEEDRGSWALVHFIRRIARLTREEIAEMERLNPRPPEEASAPRSQAQIEEDFLEGRDLVEGAGARRELRGMPPPAHRH
jgi:hypothetical protein